MYTIDETFNHINFNFGTSVFPKLLVQDLLLAYLIDSSNPLSTSEAVLYQSLLDCINDEVAFCMYDAAL